MLMIYHSRMIYIILYNIFLHIFSTKFIPKQKGSKLSCHLIIGRNIKDLSLENDYSIYV